MVLGLLLSFVSLCGLRVGATPIEDNQGGFPDELFHFGRSLQSTVNIAEVMSIPEPDLHVEDLLNFSTRVDHVCELGIKDSDLCPNYLESKSGDITPISSGKVRGRGVYLLHGLIQLMMPESDIQSRIMAARVFAICIGIALIYVVYSLAYLLFNDGRLAIASAALVGLMPSVSNILSAVSTEGPALLAVGILLLASAKIAIRGYSVPRLLVLCFGIVACLFTKITAIVPLPIVVFLLLQKAGFRWRYLLLASLFVFTVIGLVYSTYVPLKAGVAHWYIVRNPNTVSIHGTPATLAHQEYSKVYGDGLQDSPYDIGNWSIVSTYCTSYKDKFQIKDSGFVRSGLADDKCNSVRPIVQFLPNKVARSLAGKRLTIGSWILLRKGETFRSPDILLTYDNDRKDILEGENFVGNGNWQFVAHEVQIPDDVKEIGVKLDTGNQYDIVAWDGLTLAEGSFAGSGEPPVFDDVNANKGHWGGVRFTNNLKNGSAEKSWKGVPLEIVSLMSKYGSGTWANRLNGQLFTLYDLERTGVGYISGIRAMFVTFWGSFVGGDWPGLARWHYAVAIGFLGLSVVGWSRYMLLRSAIQPVMTSSIAFSLLLVVILYLMIGLFRMEVSAEWVPTLYYSTARFLLPAIIPVVLLGLAGLELLTSKRISRIMIATLVVSVFIANTWMLLRVELPYFNCTSESRWTCTDL